MEWISKYIIVPLLKILAKAGIAWAKKKVEASLNGECAKTQPLETRLKEAGLEDGPTYRFDPTQYKGKVAQLLVIAREELCDGSDPCVLIGTTTSRPSVMMSLKMAPYHEMWEQQSREYERSYSAGKFIPQRVICCTHAALSKDVTGHPVKCSEFFDWSAKTHFEVRVLFKDYEILMRYWKIKLEDFMLFGNEFVFGSLGPITDEEMKCKFHKDTDVLGSYKDMAKAVCNDKYSEIVRSVGQLETFLKKHKDWGGTRE